MEKRVYKAFGIHNLDQVPWLTERMRREIKIVGSVLPFKANSYLIEELIDWGQVPDDPIFRLSFPQPEMLSKEDYFQLEKEIVKFGKADPDTVRNIREKLNPHPAHQDKNVPQIHGIKLKGVQHKYPETVLFFPRQGQTCHAYCSFCFRWPQFTGFDKFRFSSKETDLLIEYIHQHKEITDLLFTGGDPMVMTSEVLKSYMEPILEAKIPHLQTIRIGTKSLAFWPYRYLTDPDADDILRLFERIVKQGINLAIMAHFSHPVELSTPAVQKAIRRIRSTGAQIRTQSPILRHINDKSSVWAEMWRKQVNHNCIPYYMFIPRDTGAQAYFSLPLVEAWNIFREAYNKVSGVCRTVRGPSMSCSPGKVQVLGVSEYTEGNSVQKLIVMRMLQGRNPDWVARPFFAKYNSQAIWIDQLKPAFGGNQFFFENELEEMFHAHIDEDEVNDFE